ncbi:hypothetical protein AX16_010233 [Volvariella volvacea WC 439]|nr:hypothetical protein AX16_010233 [Volvariella volvacea WC 439]
MRTISFHTQGPASQYVILSPEMLMSALKKYKPELADSAELGQFAHALFEELRRAQDEQIPDEERRTVYHKWSLEVTENILGSADRRGVALPLVSGSAGLRNYSPSS